MKPKTDSTPISPAIQHQIDMILLTKENLYWQDKARYWKTVCVVLLIGIVLACYMGVTGFDTIHHSSEVVLKSGKMPIATTR